MQDPHAHCADLVRRQDKDRFLADLFAPAEGRRHLSALHAFNAEVTRIRDLVSDPLPGEIRLQWWREALQAERPEASAHPVAAALTLTISQCRLPTTGFMRLIEAHSFDLYDEPMASVNDLEGYCGDTASVLIQLGALALAGGEDSGTAEVAGHAGVAQGVTGLLRNVALHASRGQIFVPQDVMAEAGADPHDILSGKASAPVMASLARLREVARDHLAATRARCGVIPPACVPAFLPVSLSEAYLDRMERPGYDPFRMQVEVPQWRRQWCLWRQSRRARRGG